MAKPVARIAALGVSALSASTANAQCMSLISPDLSEGGTIADERVFKAAPAAMFLPP
jgi:hypothetical protein